jgi:hypothetical protein
MGSKRGILILQSSNSVDTRGAFSEWRMKRTKLNQLRTRPMTTSLFRSVNEMGTLRQLAHSG